jgi:hypothetical protein
MELTAAWKASLERRFLYAPIFFESRSYQLTERAPVTAGLRVEPDADTDGVRRNIACELELRHAADRASPSNERVKI